MNNAQNPRRSQGNPIIWAAILVLTLLWQPWASEVAWAQDTTVRLKDIARFQGARDNQLVGLGLIVGLGGTGDGRGSQANVQMVANLLTNFGITVDQEALRLRNAAAVMVTADLPAFVRSGDRLDVAVSTFGDARSLQGGMLLQTPLQGADGEVYAVAQGAVSLGGFQVRGGGGTGVQRNHTAVGRVPSGAIVEREIPGQVVDNDQLTLVLNTPDFSTAARVANAVNEVFTPETARAEDRSSIQVTIPAELADDPVSFMAVLEEIEIAPDAVARVVINERTGTVVMGQNARIATVAVAHGNLSIRVTREIEVTEPPPDTDDPTETIERTLLEVEEEPARMAMLESGATVEEVVQALNAIGATPRDIIAILQAIKDAGALYAELRIL